jgi:hypothetical protein
MRPDSTFAESRTVPSSRETGCSPSSLYAFLALPEAFPGAFIETDLADRNKTPILANDLAARRDVFGIVNNVSVARHETIDTVDTGVFAAVMDVMALKGYTISVYGYTDDIGTQAYNLQLSQRRAEAVRDFLVQAGTRYGLPWMGPFR